MFSVDHDLDYYNGGAMDMVTYDAVSLQLARSE